jgi:hypothetical protein
LRGAIEEDALELWHAAATAYADGNAIANLRNDGRTFTFENASGVELLKQSMTAGLERWDGAAWRDVPRAHMFLCGTGWNPQVDVDEVENVYLPLSAHHRAMKASEIESVGTYRVRYPFRVSDETQPRLATLVIELDEQTFDPSGD